MLRVLLVEDEPDLREILEEGLENLQGFEVEVADNGERALELLNAAGTSLPDAVVFDLVMPRVDGRTFRESFWSGPLSRIALVLYTGVPISDHELGVDAVLEKPADLETLGRAIRVCVDRRRLFGGLHPADAHILLQVRIQRTCEEAARLVHAAADLLTSKAALESRGRNTAGVAKTLERLRTRRRRLQRKLERLQDEAAFLTAVARTAPPVSLSGNPPHPQRRANVLIS